MRAVRHAYASARDNRPNGEEDAIFFDLSEESNARFSCSQAVRCGDLVFADQLATEDPAFIPSTRNVG